MSSVFSHELCIFTWVVYFHMSSVFSHELCIFTWVVYFHMSSVFSYSVVKLWTNAFSLTVIAVFLHLLMWFLCLRNQVPRVNKLVGLFYFMCISCLITDVICLVNFKTNDCLKKVIINFLQKLQNSQNFNNNIVLYSEGDL